MEGRFTSWRPDSRAVTPQPGVPAIQTRHYHNCVFPSRVSFDTYAITETKERGQREMETRAKEPGFRKRNYPLTHLWCADFAFVTFSLPIQSDLIRPNPSKKIKSPNKPIFPLPPRGAFVGLCASHFVFGHQKTHRSQVKHTETHQNKGRGCPSAFRTNRTRSESTPVAPNRSQSWCTGQTLDIGLWTLDSGKYQLPSPRSLIVYWAFPEDLPRRSVAEAGAGEGNGLNFLRSCEGRGP